MQKIRYLFLLLILSISYNGISQNRELVQVVIGNEGNFDTGNATLTNYLIENKTATDGVFLAKNGTGIGDVVQSITWIKKQLYVVLNNSQKIVILDPDTFQQARQISLPAGSSPREMVQVSEDKAYVTDMYGSLAYIVNINDYSVSATVIPAGLNADQIVEYEGFAYIANYGFGADSTIFKVDVSTDAVVDTFVVSRGPGGMEVDANGTLWVVCAGYPGDFDESFNVIPGTSKPGGVHGINLSNGEEVAFAELPSAGSDIALDEAQSKVYVNTGGLRAFDISTQTFSADTLLKGSFYAFDYDKENQQFYLANAKDFSSAGEITLYKESEGVTGTFSAGIIPGSFLFVYDDMLHTSSENSEMIVGFELNQNYPNPFNPTTQIQYSIHRGGQVQLAVFNSIGKKVAELVNSTQAAGVQSVQFNASNLSSGIYFYRIVTPSGSLVRKMMLIK